MMTRAPAVPGCPLPELLRNGPVVLAFFKVSCPVCQLAFPFLERLHAAGHTGLQFVGVSQDEAPVTKQFLERCGVTFPVLYDRESAGYPASNAFRITHVPTVFVVEVDGSISHSWSGFSKADFEKLALRAGAVVFRAGEDVPSWKAG
jgi:peroxiredoxin